MRSDRSLLSFAVFALIIQLVWLAVEIDLLPTKFLRRGNFEQKRLGEVSVVQNQLRRRAQNQLYWQEGRQLEEVKTYDSLLTLSQSSATVHLDSGINLTLAENTLIFFEPPQKDSKDSRIRIRFDRGNLRSKTGEQNASFEVKSWTITAKEGTDLQIQANPEGQLEVQVLSGLAELNKPDTPSPILIQNSSVTVNKQNEVKKDEFDNHITWTGEQKKDRVYAHQFPVPFQLQWKGKVTEFEIKQGEQVIVKEKIPVGSNNFTVALSEGTYAARLRSDKGISAWRTVEIWRAPVIHLVSPLPRDRMLIDELTKFIWTKPEGVFEGKIEISEDPQFLQKNKIGQSRKNFLDSRSPASGKQYWRIIGVDQEGFEIPSPYSNPIYFEKELLQAPSTKEPEIVPEKPKLPESSWFQLFIKPAFAEEMQKALHFQWQAVPEAEHYVLEVSSTKDFRDLLMEIQTKDNQFVWKNYPEKVDKLYWRVAGESQTKLGRFSAVQEVKLSSLKSAESQPAPYQVTVKKIIPAEPEDDDVGDSEPKLVLKPAAKPPPPEPSPLLWQMPIVALPGDSLTEIKPELPPPPLVMKAPPKKRREVTVSHQLLFGLNYVQQTNEDYLQSKQNFKGLVPEIFWQEKIPVDSFVDDAGTEVQFTSIEWKSQDKWTSSRGEKLVQNDLSALMWGQKNHLKYYLGVASKGRPERVDMELLQMKTEIYGQVGLAYTASATEFRYLYSKSSATDWHGLQYSYLYSKYRNKKLNKAFQIGPVLRYDMLKSSDGLKGTHYGVGLRLGYSW